MITPTRTTVALVVGAILIAVATSPSHAQQARPRANGVPSEPFTNKQTPLIPIPAGVIVGGGMQPNIGSANGGQPNVAPVIRAMPESSFVTAGPMTSYGRSTVATTQNTGAAPVVDYSPDDEADETPPEPAPQSARVAKSRHASNLFATHSWYVPPPPPPYVPPPPPPPPPPPTAPPLPFTYLGSYTPLGDATIYFLSKSDRVFDVRVGDSIESTYQVESAGQGQLTFKFLPLNQSQTLVTGATP